MTAKNKRRGNDFEREVIETAKKMGLDAQRAWASDGRSLGKSPGVDVVLGCEDFQCKRRKKIAEYLIPESDVDGVIFRQDGNKQAYIVLRLVDYLATRIACRRAMRKLAELGRGDEEQQLIVRRVTSEET